MKNLKKVLSLVLALAMALSLMTVAFAADESNYADYDEVTYNEAVDVMSAVGVFDGMGGSFNPDGTLTREQAAKIITYMLMGKSNADKLTTTIAPYGDVSADRWSAGAIAYCTNEGIISGMGNNKFAPSDEVTGLQFAKMLLVAIGYDAGIEGLTGESWAINASKLAIAVGLDDGMEEVSLSGKLTREQACQMAFNAMQTPLVEYESKGTTIEVNGATVTFGAQKASYVTTTIAKEQTISDTTLSNTNNNTYTVEFAEKYCQKLVLEGDANALEQPVRVWSYDGDEIGTYATDADKVAVVADKDKTIEDVLLGNSYMNYNNRDIETLKYTATGGGAHYNVFVNGDQKDTASYGATALTKGDVVYAYEDANGDVYKVVVARYTYAQIDNVTTNLSASEKESGAAYRLKLVDVDGYPVTGDTYYDAHDDESKILNGFDAASYTEDTVLAVALSNAGEVVDSYVAKVVTGKPNAVTEVTSGNAEKGSITIDGTKYNFTNYIDGIVKDFDFDNEYAVYTTKEDYAIGIVGVTAANVDDLYYVTGVYSKTSTYGEANKEYYVQRVSLADGSMDTVQVEYGSLEVVADTTTLTGDYAITNDITGAGVKWAGLYTFNDKKIDEQTLMSGTSTAQKAGNGVYTMVAFVDDTAITADFKATGTTMGMTNGADEVTGGVKADATKITTDNGTYYVNENTKFLAVSDKGSDIDVSYAQGGMKLVTATAVPTIVVYDKVDNKTAIAVVYADDSLTISTATANVVYLASAPTVKNSNNTWQADLYYMADNSVQTVALDSNAYGRGFYVYSEKDGVLKLESTPMVSASVGATGYEDEAGPEENLVIDEVYKNALFGTTDADFNDINFVGDLLIIDNRSDSEISADPYYTSPITSIPDLAGAIKAGANVSADIYFDDGATFIAVNSLAAVAPGAPGAGGYASAADGVYIDSAADFNTAGLAGVNDNSGYGSEGVLVLKFTSPKAQDYTCEIKDAAGTVIMTQTGNVADTNAHQFFWDINAGPTGYVVTLDAGAAYSYSITGEDGTVVISGNFVYNA